MAKEDRLIGEDAKKIIQQAAAEHASKQFPVAMIDERMQELRLAIGEELLIPQILEYMMRLSQEVDTPQGRGMLKGLHELAGGINKTYHVAVCSTAFGVQHDIYGIYDDDYRPFLALGLGWVGGRPPKGELYIAAPLTSVNPGKKIGYTKKECGETEEVAEFLMSFIFSRPIKRDLREAENPGAACNIVNEGHAVYFRFGEVFAPPNYAT